MLIILKFLLIFPDSVKHITGLINCIDLDLELIGNDIPGRIEAGKSFAHAISGFVTLPGAYEDVIGVLGGLPCIHVHWSLSRPSSIVVYMAACPKNFSPPLASLFSLSDSTESSSSQIFPYQNRSIILSSYGVIRNSLHRASSG